MCAAKSLGQPQHWDVRDFALLIEAEAPGRCRVRVLEAPNSPGANHNEFTYPAADLQRIHLATATERPGRDGFPSPSATATRDLRRRRDGLAASAEAAREAGEWLFEALFRGDVLKAFYKSQGEVERLEKGALRIRLVLDWSAPKIAEIAALPWEVLRAPGSVDFLACSGITPVVRFLQIPQATRDSPPLPTLRILVVAVNPPGLPTLDLDKEMKQLQSTFEGNSRVVVEVLRPATAKNLMRRLAASPDIHVVHFMGHGRGGRGIEA